jgi:hypothetical protein
MFDVCKGDGVIGGGLEKLTDRLREERQRTDSSKGFYSGHYLHTNCLMSTIII